MLVCLLGACSSPYRLIGSLDIELSRGQVRLLAHDGHVQNDHYPGERAFFLAETDSGLRREVLAHGLGSEFPETRLHTGGDGSVVAVVGTGFHGVAVLRLEDSAFVPIAALDSPFCESWVGEDGLVRVLAGDALHEVREEGVTRVKAAVLECNSRVENQFIPSGNEGGFLVRRGSGGPGMVCPEGPCPAAASVARLNCGADECLLGPAEGFGNFGYDGAEPQRTRIASLLLPDGSPCIVSLRPHEDGNNYVPIVLTSARNIALEMERVFTIGATATEAGLAVAMLTYAGDLYVQRLNWDGAALDAEPARQLDQGVRLGAGERLAATSTPDEVAFAYALEGTTVRVQRIPNDGGEPTAEDFVLDPE